MTDAFDDESGDDLQPQKLPTPPQSGGIISAETRKAGRPKKPVAAASRVTKPASKRKSTEGLAGRAASTAGRRKALEEIHNQETAASGTKDVDDFDALSKSPLRQQTVVPMAGAKATAKRVRKPKAGAQVEKAASGVEESHADTSNTIKEIPETQEDVSATSKLAHAKSKVVNKPPKPAMKEVIPETQPEPMDVEEQSESGDVGEDFKGSEEEQLIPRQRVNNRTINKTRQQQTSVAHRRGASASDTERGGNDPSTRRKLSDMTAKLELLQLKYQNLKEVAVQEGESNFDTLKQHSDERSAASDVLIASLRSDLAHQTELASQAAQLRAQVAESETTANELKADNKALKASLAEAQQEMKALQARLSATRSASHPAESGSGKAPGSAIKTQHGQGPKMLLAGSAEAAKEAHKSMLKEELYRDLTGLIVREVKSAEAEGEDVYDCIQTGRNGTLHFHLTTSNGASSNDNSTVASYEDAEFTYMPRLDINRDKDLLEILPDYLTDGEGICFPRSNAAKFYGRVADSLTKKIEVMDE